MPRIARTTGDYLLLAHIQHTNAGTGQHTRRRDPAAWWVSAALIAIALLLAAFGGS